METTVEWTKGGSGLCQVASNGSVAALFEVARPVLWALFWLGRSSPHKSDSPCGVLDRGLLKTRLDEPRQTRLGKQEQMDAKSLAMELFGGGQGQKAKAVARRALQEFETASALREKNAGALKMGVKNFKVKTAPEGLKKDSTQVLKALDGISAETPTQTSGVKGCV